MEYQQKVGKAISERESKNKMRIKATKQQRILHEIAKKKMMKRKRKIIRKSSMLIRKEVTSTHIPSKKRFTSEGWYYVLSGDETDESDEFSKTVDPYDQAIVDNIWKDDIQKNIGYEKEQRKKNTRIYHPVASPSTFPIEDEPFTIYGSMHSAINKQTQNMDTSPHGWKSWMILLQILPMQGSMLNFPQI